MTGGPGPRPGGTAAGGPPVTIVPLPGIPEVQPGDDLAGLLLAAVRAAGWSLADGDVLAVTSKMVAKAEGRLIPLPADPDERAAATAAAIAAETVREVARRGDFVIAETVHGFVGANALVDASNTGGRDCLVLLPVDPDASAARLRAAITAATGADVAVVVTDTLGRPWRLGQTDVAVGLAGMGAIEDYRGRPDADGRPMATTEIAVADEVAAAAELVKGKTIRVGAALLRGVRRPLGDGGARRLVRPAADDLFRTGSGPEDLVAFAGSPLECRSFAPDPVDPAAVRRAAAAAAAAPLGRRTHSLRLVEVATPAARARYLDAMEAAWRAGLDAAGAGGVEAAAGGAPAERRVASTRALLGGAPVLLVPCLAPEEGDPQSRDPDGRDPRSHAPQGHDPDRRGGAAHELRLLVAGGAVHVLLLALSAQGLGTAWLPSSLLCQQAAAAALDLPRGWLPLGSVVAGHPDRETPSRPRPPADPGTALVRR